MNIHTKTVVLIVGICLGIVIGEVSGFATEVAITITALVFTQALLLLANRRQITIDSKYKISLITILFCIGLIVGIVRVQLVEAKNNFVCEKSCTFDAKIISSPEQKDTYQVVIVRPVVRDPTSSEGYTGTHVQVRIPLYPKYEIGDTIQITGTATTPKVFVPHEDNKKSFDYASYLMTRNVGSEMFFPNIVVLDKEVHSITDYLGRWKDDLITRMGTYVRAPESLLASGMLFGASSFSKELTQTFRTAGLSHIVVLSGFNIAIVISFILFVFTFLPLVARITLAGMSVVLFVIMVGGEASVIRATLMAFITLLATLLGRHYVAKQALLVSLLLIVMYEPYALLHDVSLHLSFLATAGIVYLGEVFERIFQTISVKSVRELFVTTLSAYISTLPYSMYTFGSVSVYALIANVIVLPFVPLAMMLSFSVVVMSYISHTLSLLFGFVDTTVIACVLYIAETVERLPMSSFMFTISFLEMCVMYVALYFLVLYVLHTKFSTSKNSLHEQGNETKSTHENGVLTDIIRY